GAREAVDLDDQHATLRRLGRPAEVESPHESVEQALEAQGEVVEWHPELYCSVAQAREERGWCSTGSPGFARSSPGLAGSSSPPRPTAAPSRRCLARGPTMS